MPRPGTPLIHPRMLGQTMAVAAGTHLSVCQLVEAPPERPGTFDPATGTYPVVNDVVLWTGPCRVQAQARSAVTEVDAAGRPATLTSYQVTLSRLAPLPGKDDLVRITASPDPALAGLTLRVTDAAVDDLSAERRLLCELGG